MAPSLDQLSLLGNTINGLYDNHPHMIQRRVWVTGRVQGVSFRASTAEQAEHYKAIRGYVKNLNDGRVEAVFSGPESDVLALVEWCKKGPPSAKVTQVEVREESVDSSLTSFRILRQ